ncbi:hypothetical protein [Rhodocyclus tenuis]|uniref:Uncharacterized protein n=1 Tax=Rhodocyclus tenuis TaxID=1066 RepID=A0A840G282_RHOTE|nr:hypothetical protein [Rhodocyclus tenuis]MBB4248497.1 hypothetical protein [Rhodocyclus tenuis]
MEWRGTSEGKSIFAGKEKRLGRPLTALEKALPISKYTAIIAFISLIPFLSADLWEASHLHITPLEKSYASVSLRLGGGGKSPPVIVLTEGGKDLFVSSCDGLKELLCREEYSENPAVVDMAVVIEVSPGKGVIKRINMSDKLGKEVVVTNPYANTWAKSYQSNPYQKNWFLLVIFVGAVLVFLVLSISSTIINSRSRRK